MPTDFFDKKENIPTFDHLEKVLQESYQILKELIDYISNSYGDLAPCWKYYSPKYGWTLKMLFKKRNLFFITPDRDKFYISFVFGDKSVEAVNLSQISESIKNELNNARRYAEGRGVRLEIMDRGQLEDLKQLADIKIDNKIIFSNL
jgi:signal transduction histidine kinase